MANFGVKLPLLVHGPGSGGCRLVSQAVDLILLWFEYFEKYAIYCSFICPKRRCTHWLGEEDSDFKMRNRRQGRSLVHAIALEQRKPITGGRTSLASDETKLSQNSIYASISAISYCLTGWRAPVSCCIRGLGSIFKTREHRKSPSLVRGVDMSHLICQCLGSSRSIIY